MCRVSHPVARLHLRSQQSHGFICIIMAFIRTPIGGGAYWAGRAAARPLFGLKDNNNTNCYYY